VLVQCAYPEPALQWFVCYLRQQQGYPCSAGCAETVTAVAVVPLCALCLCAGYRLSLATTWPGCCPGPSWCPWWTPTTCTPTRQWYVCRHNTPYAGHAGRICPVGKLQHSPVLKGCMLTVYLCQKMSAQTHLQHCVALPSVAGYAAATTCCCCCYKLRLLLVLLVLCVLGVRSRASGTIRLSSRATCAHRLATSCSR